jgi:hypothetical protein
MRSAEKRHESGTLDDCKVDDIVNTGNGFVVAVALSSRANAVIVPQSCEQMQ